MDDQDVDTDGQIELLWLASLNSLADTGMTDRDDENDESLWCFTSPF